MVKVSDETFVLYQACKTLKFTIFNLLVLYIFLSSVTNSHLKLLLLATSPTPSTLQDQSNHLLDLISSMLSLSLYYRSSILAGSMFAI